METYDLKPYVWDFGTELLISHFPEPDKEGGVPGGFGNKLILLSLYVKHGFNGHRSIIPILNIEICPSSPFPETIFKSGRWGKWLSSVGGSA